MDNHNSVKTKGIIKVPMTNCRIVRPLEIRAKKSPTKGDHATHQAQKNSVQLFINLLVYQMQNYLMSCLKTISVITDI